MAKPLEPYRVLIVESYEPKSLSGKEGKIHCRPIDGQGVSTSLDVECSRSIRNFPVGTRFSVKAKLTDRAGGGQYWYSHHSWPVEKVDVL